MNKHREVLARDLGLCEDRQRTMLINADKAKKDGHVNDESYFRREADEDQERADAIHHALKVMRKAETLPKIADGVAVWPIDWVWVWDKEKNGTITTSRVSAHENWSFIYLYYSTEQAARDAAGEEK